MYLRVCVCVQLMNISNEYFKKYRFGIHLNMCAGIKNMFS